MKKRIIIILVCLSCFLTGCENYNKDKIVKDFSKKVNKLKSYKLNGELAITNNDNVYNYNVEVSYKKSDFYKVVLTNISNDHAQVILKNKEGVFIITPSLNKSFKFQSEWPYNNSQIYLLGALANDLVDDKDIKFEKKDNKYYFKTKVNYPNNSNLKSQKIEFDKKLNIKKVTVYDTNKVITMEMKFKNIDYSPTFKKDYFEVDSVMSSFDEIFETKETISLDESIYPLFIPDGTKLSNEEHIKNDYGERIIMTFRGENPFTLVEEVSGSSDEFTVIPTMGEPYRLMDTLGTITENSLSWSSGGIDYYLVSDVMSSDDLVEIAQSISVLPTMK